MCRHSRPGASSFIAAVLSLAIVSGCHESSAGSSSPQPLDIVVGQAASVPADPQQRNFSGTAPAAGSCANTADIACMAGCCPAESSCSSAGAACQEPTEGACPASLPVACSTTATECVTTTTSCSALDASPFGNTVTLTAPAAYTGGRFGSGVHLGPLQAAPCGAEVGAPTAGFPIGDEPMTIEGWFAFSTTDDTMALFSYGDLSTANARMLVAGGGYELYWWEGPGSQLCSSPRLTKTFVDGTWHFFAMTYSAGEISLFVDGAPAVTCEDKGPLATPAGTTFELGQYLQPGGNLTGADCVTVPGTVDEVRVLNVAETPAQIAADFTSGPMSVTAGTVGLWHFDETAQLSCCPAGTTCAADGSCATRAGSGVPSECPDGGASVCPDGSCCPGGATCTNDACIVTTSSLPTCPATAPVDCNDGTCCPAGWTCDSGACDQPQAGTTGDDSACPAGTTFMGSTSDNSFGCCPSIAADDGTLTCSGGSLCIVNQGQLCPPSCPPGYACDVAGAANECAAVVTGMKCGADVEGSPFVCTSGCCAGGEACTSGYCCPAGNPSCACPTGSSVIAGRICQQTAVVASCSGATVPCGNACCGVVATSHSGLCPAAAPIPCGTSCCSAGASCVNGTCTLPPVSPACDADHPLACNNGGVCCKANETCASDGAGGVTCVFSDPDAGPRSGPQGLACGTGFCEPGQLCSNGTCCPPTDPVGCGPGNCCPGGTTCQNGQCGCPNGGVACGANCCKAGSECINGQCVAGCNDPAAPVPCGPNICCGAGKTCQDVTTGDCSCPADHPVKCQTVCCLPGAVCMSDGSCDCPNGDDLCGDVCCPVGQACNDDDVCAPVTGGGSCDGNCPNGYCGACGSTADCCAGAVCISSKYCLVDSVATGCDCGAYETFGTSGVCGDFAGNGAPQITSCGAAGTASCNTTTSWCCPGLVGVQNGANCTCEDPASSGYECPGM